MLLPGIVAENYQYDGLQRLTQSSRVGVVGAVPINTSYSPSGNLRNKSDNGQDVAGAYVYGINGCGPHAVGQVTRPAPAAARSYGCDANGNVVSGNEINAVYDFMNLPRIVNRVGSPAPGSTQFRYDANGQRFEEVTGSGETTRFGPKGYEKVTRPGATPRHRHELGQVIVTRVGGTDEVTYATRDRMGSLAAALPSNPFKGDMRSYDPFGNPRLGWFADIGKQTATGFLAWRPMTARGFTGHEHIDEGRVIHMNGRIYDYALGRFLGPDPIIQFPSNSQSLNPYSYIMNNPFAGTDPSGYTMQMLMGRSPMARRMAKMQSLTAEGCVGKGFCQEVSDRRFLQGPRADMRLTAGGAPPGRGPKNGAEFKPLLTRDLNLAADKIGLSLLRYFDDLMLSDAPQISESAIAATTYGSEDQPPAAALEAGPLEERMEHPVDGIDIPTRGSPAGYADGSFSPDASRRTRAGVGRPHYGVDLINAVDSEVRAATSGKVAYAGIMAGYGKTVVIRSGGTDPIYMLYAHLKLYSVESGDRIGIGARIGAVGVTGNSNPRAPHLHLEVSRGGYARGSLRMDPMLAIGGYWELEQ